MLFPLWLALAAAAQSSTATPFRTAVNPRIDPVFGDVTVLRRTVDRFLALQAEMDQVRNEFSTAVHSTLAELARPTGPHESHAAKVCPPAAPALYGRALAAGGRYLAIGREMESRFREIRRADELGDASGLTPGLSSEGQEGEPDPPGHAARPARDARRFLRATGRRVSPRRVRCAGLGRGGSPAAGAEDAVPTDPSNPAAWTLDDSAATRRPAGTRIPAEPCARRPRHRLRPPRHPRFGSRSTTRTAPGPPSCRSTADPTVPCPATSEPRCAPTPGRTKCACCPASTNAHAASPAPSARCTSTKAGP